MTSGDKKKAAMEETVKWLKELSNTNTVDHPRNPSLEVKMDALHRYFELRESIKSVSKEIGYTKY